MRLCHISDSHGRFPRLNGNFDVIVHSGDWLPDFAAPKDRYEYLQEAWVKENIETIKAWIGNKPFLFEQGNHDFANPNAVEYYLRQAGIDAHNLENKIVSIDQTNFYGFPYVPPINGCFNYETDDNDMSKEIDNLAQIMNKTYIDVLVSHCPPYGVFGKCLHANTDWGNSYLTNLFDYKLDKDMMPSALLVGHIHSSYGVKIHKGMLVSNAATTQNIVEL